MDAKMIEELPRAKRHNPHNFTEEEWTKRDLQIKALEAKYPTIPLNMLQLLVDNTLRKSSEELDELIKSGKWEKPNPRTKERQTGGIWTEGCYAFEDTPEDRDKINQLDLEISIKTRKNAEGEIKDN